MSATVTVTCFTCGQVSTFNERVGFRDECDKCHADSRVCKNCRFYDPKVYNECKEPSAEFIQEKERSNRCDFFQGNGAVGSKSSPSPTDLLSAAENLFKKKE